MGGEPALLLWFALHPPAGVDVVSFFITSRFAGQSDSPGLPHDVHAGHPLRQITPQRLSRSPAAADVALAAKNELVRLLTGPPAHRELLGIITASGGGLTLKDLERLSLEFRS